jgi:hypothetical protein
MALSQKGATYKNQAELSRKDRLLGEGLDDLASQVAAVRLQGNFGKNGAISAPSSPTALQVTPTAGLLTATIVHNSAPAGTQYVLQYSTAKNFLNPISEVLTHTPSITTTWQKALPAGGQYYLRVAAKFPASPLGSWVYYGTPAAPVVAAI